MSQSESLWDVNSRQKRPLVGRWGRFQGIFAGRKAEKNLASKGVQECVFNFLQAYCVKK